MEPLAKRLSDPQKAGVHQTQRTHAPEEIEEAAREAGLAVFRIDIGSAGDKKALLDRIAKVAQFPDWFGYNWDALNDCLGDLDWLAPKTGYVFIFENAGRFASGHKQDFEKTVDVFRAASEYWRAEGRPFWLFV